ncbi:MAG: uridine kinase [Candidatus Eisenbacteria bacterium]
MKRPLLVGIAGGTSAGKSTFARLVAEEIGTERALILAESSYYHDKKSAGARAETINFDHPDSIDFGLMRKHLEELIGGRSIPRLVYHRDASVREETGERIEPRRVIIVEGILILAADAVRELLDVKIFIDADSDLRFIRRLGRDLTEKGLDFEDICTAYLERIKPMHLRFVVASKRHADIIVPMGGRNVAAVEMVISRIQTALAEGDASGS